MSQGFPAGFVWGVATSAHQIEGQNLNNDWWAFEHDPASGCAEVSGDACDSFHRFEEDIELVASLRLSAYRFSLEWSRIEPAEGEWSRAALEHYRRMCAACAERGVEPVVTFHHFTNPRWFAARGGWEAKDAPERFARFVERAAAHLGNDVAMACTINEPNVVAVLGYMRGIYPPQVSDLARYDAVNRNLARAHRLAAEALRSAPGDFPVGLTLSMDDMVAEEGGERICAAARAMLEDVYFEATEGDDFIGVQAYTRLRFGPDGELGPAPGVALTQLGTEYWPAAVEATVRRAAASTGLPVVVTENGIATSDDAQRVAYLTEALEGLSRCLADGVDVRGYFVWSLLDNFEWHLGYRPTLGLVAVDRTTFERRPKASAAWFAEVARRNAVFEGPR